MFRSSIYTARSVRTRLLLLSAAALCFSFSSIGFSPPGTVKLKLPSGELHVDKTEILNIYWAEYVHYQIKHHGENSDEHKAALPDSAVWSSAYDSNWKNASSRFARFPVVGITYEQAIEFCKWRSDRVIEKYEKQVLYRLPTKEEWIEFAQVEKKSNLTNAADTLVEASKKGKIVNLHDNVSEMIAEKGIAMGSNWRKQAGVDSSDGMPVVSYDAPSNYVGFRCVAEIRYGSED